MHAYQRATPGYEARRRSVLSGLAAGAGVRYVHVRRAGSWWRPRYSHDANHLTLPGARRMVDQLWDVAAFRTTVRTGLERPWPGGPTAAELAADPAAGVALPPSAQPVPAADGR